MTDTQWPIFEVFHQQARGEPHVYVGSVHATDAQMETIKADLRRFCAVATTFRAAGTDIEELWTVRAPDRPLGASGVS